MESPEPAHGQAANGDHLLEVIDLRVNFRTPDGLLNAVNGISYTLNRGQTLAILGESGSGKTVSAEAVMGILDSPPAFVTGGTVLFDGIDLLQVSPSWRRRLCGERIAMIFQDPLTALNPAYTVGSQIAGMFQEHRGTSKREATAKAVELMDRVRIPSARERAHDYPHQFSGGMRQRVMIAAAIALDPDLLNAALASASSTSRLVRLWAWAVASRWVKCTMYTGALSAPSSSAMDTCNGVSRYSTSRGTGR